MRKFRKIIGNLRWAMLLACMAWIWPQAGAATMFVKGTTAPYYKIGSGSYTQMTASTTTGGVTWYYADVTSGTMVTFATSSSGAGASPSITFSSSADSYFHFASGTAVNLTYQKSYNTCWLN